jgi:hypothetical protein
MCAAPLSLLFSKNNSAIIHRRKVGGKPFFHFSGQNLERKNREKFGEAAACFLLFFELY